MAEERLSLGALAAVRGDGVLLTAEAVGAGWPRRALYRRLASDGWTRIGAGAWAEPGQVVDAVLRLRAVQLERPELVVSHRSAAALHEVELLVAPHRLVPSAEFTGTGRRKLVLNGAVLHRAPIAVHEVTGVRGLRATTVPRTLVDLLCADSREEALVAVESAVTRRRLPSDPTRRRPPLTTLAQIGKALEAARGRPGVASAREWLMIADAGAGSPPETIARLRIRDAGLRPESQVRLTSPRGRVMRPDFLFVVEGLVVEIEGYGYHGSRADHQRDAARYNELSVCPGVRGVLRFTAEDVLRRPMLMIRDIENALAELAARRDGR